MNDYIKPTINLVAAIADTGTSAACTTTAEDMDLIKDITGITDTSKFFGIGESCAVEIEMYCKFTSVENGASKAFSS